MALTSAACGAWALSLGRATSVAILGQPLNLMVAVGLDAGEEISPACISADVYFGDNRQASPAVRVRLDGSTIRVSTNTPIDEPVVTAYVMVGCNARVTRKFVAFADPPPVNPAQSTAQGSDQAAPNTPAQVSTLGAAPVPNAASAPGSRRASRSASRATRSVGAAASARKPEPAARLLAKRAEREPPRPRLQLDPVDPDVLINPNLRLDNRVPAAAGEGSAEQRAAASALWRTLNATPQELTRDREQLQKLEEQFASLRRDTAAMHDSVRSLEARLQQSEQARYANPLVYALTALCAALLALLGALLWRQRRERQAAAWWAAAPDPREARSEALPPPAPIAAPVVQQFAESVASAPSGLFAPTSVETYAQAPAPVGIEKESIAANEPRREVSVEELIDLEQQAEFFVVLGQDEAAIDLLMGHVRSTAGTSPLPYLKLLEIYQRRGERMEYERVRDRFNSRFNAYAPSWDEDLQDGHALEDYPAVVARLENLWATPTRALEVLQASLLRQDESAGTFHLPAYRELLFLYAIARDLSEREEPGNSVDLLLPLDDDDDAASFTLTTMGPLVAEPAKAVVSGESPAVDLALDVEPQQASAQHSGIIEFERLDLTQPLPQRKG